MYVCTAWGQRRRRRRRLRFLCLAVSVARSHWPWCRWMPHEVISRIPDERMETLKWQRAQRDGSGQRRVTPRLAQTNRSKSVARARSHAGQRPAADTTMVVLAPAKLAEMAGGSINFSSCCCRWETEFGSGQPSDRSEVIDFCRRYVDRHSRQQSRSLPVGQSATYGSGIQYNRPAYHDQYCLLHKWMITLRCRFRYTAYVCYKEICYCRGTARRATSVEILRPFFDWAIYLQEALLMQRNHASALSVEIV